MRRTLVLAVVSVAVLAGCSSTSTRSVSQTGHELDIEPCMTVEDQIVDVEDLETVSPVSCELSAVVLRFPDGSRLELDEAAGTGGLDAGDGRTYGFGSFAIYGVAVFSDIPGEDRTWWGTPEGIRRLQYLEGLVDSYR
jgi:ABC-type glycerol-3-phosphate transport system substrate-binding protein